MNKNLVGIFGIIMLVSLLANIFLGYNFLNPKKSPVGSVCGKEVIKKWNSAYDSTDFKNQIKNVVSEIEKKADFENDSNCLAIKYFSADHNAEVLKKLKAKVDKGENPDLNIRGVKDLNISEYVGETKITDLGDAENVYDE